MPDLKKTLARCVCCAVVLAAWPSRTAEAPPTAERVLFGNGQMLSTTGRAVVDGTFVLQLRDGGELAVAPDLVDRIEVDAAGLPRPVEESAKTVPISGLALPSRPYAEIVAAASERHGVDPLLVHALIEAESAYRADATSARGAAGLMQLMPVIVEHLGVDDPYDPATNIEAGTRYLRSLLDKFGTRGAIAAYNAGEAAVRQFNGVPPYRETRYYVGRVLALVDAHRDAASGETAN